MNRKTYLPGILLLFAAAGYGQGLTQSADGKSTIPLKGSAIGLDLAKTELSLGYNNLNTVVKNQNFSPVYGLAVKVKNEDGIGNLFSAGDQVPSGTGSVYAGFTFSNAFSNNVLALAAADQRQRDRFQTWQDKYRKNEKQALIALISSVCEEADVAAVDIIPVEQDLLNTLDAQAFTEKYYTDIKDKTNADRNIQAVYDAIKDYAKEVQERFTEKKTKLVSALNASDQLYRASSYQRFTVYGFYSISSTSFKRFNALDTSSFSKSFKSMNDRTDEIGLGLNYQVNNFWFGLTYSYALTNNFSALSKKEYTLTSTNKNATQQLVQESKITAYAGDYGTLHINNLNADVVARVKLDDKYKNALLINPYLRGVVFSRNTDLLVNQTALGTGFYFMQKKFIGGFYIELPDINNNAEKQKPEAEQILRRPLQRLTFGVVTKFNISTLANW